MAVLEERINNGAFKKNAGIKTKEFRNRFRPTHPLRMGTYRENGKGEFKRTARSKFNKLERLAAVGNR